MAPQVRGASSGRAPPPATTTTATPAPAASGVSKSDAARRASALEAGKVLQRLLADAPGAHAVRPIAGAAAASVERALSEAATIELHVPVIPPPNAADVKARLEELARHHGRVEHHREGESVGANDEAELDVTGYVQGKVFLTQPPSWYVVETNAHLPGLFEGLVGVKVGGQALVNITLPDDYPVPGLGGKKAVFAVDVRAAMRRAPLVVGSPEFLERAGIGASLAEAKQRTEAEILGERAAQMIDIAKALFLRALYARCEADEVPEALVVEELYKRWRAAKGDSLIRQGIALDDQRQSQNAFAADVSERYEARRAVWEMRMLEALAEQAGIHVDDDELLKIIAPAAGAAGVRRIDVEAMLRKNDQVRRGLLRNLKIDRAVAIVLGRGTILFDGPNIAAPFGDAQAGPPKATTSPRRGLSAGAAPRR